MSYYHVTNKNIIDAIDTLNKQFRAQRDAFNALLKKYGCAGGYVHDEGMVGLKFEGKSWDNLDKKLWVHIGNPYPRNARRPHGSMKVAKSIREEFSDVGFVDTKLLCTAIPDTQWPVILPTGGCLLHPGYIYLEESNKYLISIDNRYIEEVNLPEGVEEITWKQFKEWEV